MLLSPSKKLIMLYKFVEKQHAADQVHRDLLILHDSRKGFPPPLNYCKIVMSNIP